MLLITDLFNRLGLDLLIFENGMGRLYHCIQAIPSKEMLIAE